MRNMDNAASRKINNKDRKFKNDYEHNCRPKLKELCIEKNIRIDLYAWCIYALNSWHFYVLEVLYDCDVKLLEVFR